MTIYELFAALDRAIERAARTRDRLRGEAMRTAFDFDEAWTDFARRAGTDPFAFADEVAALDPADRPDDVAAFDRVILEAFRFQHADAARRACECDLARLEVVRRRLLAAHSRFAGAADELVAAYTAAARELARCAKEPVRSPRPPTRSTGCRNASR